MIFYRQARTVGTTASDGVIPGGGQVMSNNKLSATYKMADRGTGNCGHVVSADKGEVELSNDDDPYYYQIFKSLAELNSLIEELKEAGRKAFEVKS